MLEPKWTQTCTKCNCTKLIYYLKDGTQTQIHAEQRNVRPEPRRETQIRSDLISQLIANNKLTLIYKTLCLTYCKVISLPLCARL